MGQERTVHVTEEYIRINISVENEVRHWSSRLGVRPEELVQAVVVVGPSVKQVARYLGKTWPLGDPA